MLPRGGDKLKRLQAVKCEAHCDCCCSVEAWEKKLSDAATVERLRVNAQWLWGCCFFFSRWHFIQLGASGGRSAKNPRCSLAKEKNEALSYAKSSKQNADDRYYKVTGRRSCTALAGGLEPAPCASSSAPSSGRVKGCSYLNVFRDEAQRFFPTVNRPKVTRIKRFFR